MHPRSRTRIIVLSWLGLFTCSGATVCVAANGVPLLDVNADSGGQKVGDPPLAAIGTVKIPSAGVTVDAAQPGMNGQTILVMQSAATPHLIVSPIDAPFSTGVRQFTFLVKYDPVFAGKFNSELFNVGLRDSSNNTLADLVFAGVPQINNVPAGKCSVVVNNQTLNSISAVQGLTHAVSVTLDASNPSVKTFSVVLDSTTVVSGVHWPSNVSDLDFIDFSLTTQSPPATPSLVHLDSLLMVDPNAASQDWTGGADLSWSTAANWSTNVAPTGGTVFIRRATGGDVLGPAGLTTLANLVLDGDAAGIASLRLAAEMDVSGLNISPRGRMILPAGTTLRTTAGWSLDGTLQMAGGTLSGASFANDAGGVISGFGTINAVLSANAAGATIQADANAANTVTFTTGTINDQGTLDCNGGRVNLASGVALVKSGNGVISLHGGTLRSPTSLRIATTTGRLDGPGTLEIGGTFTCALPAVQMSLSSLDIVLINAANFEALSADVGNNGQTLAGLPNVLRSLRVGANALTLTDNFSRNGGANALYVTNLDLTGTTQDAGGGRVYYQNLVGGANTFNNYVPLQHIAPQATILAPAGDVTIHAGRSVTFSGAAVDPDNSPGAMTFLWTFGAGSGVPDSTNQNPGAAVFPNTGTFQVTFTVTDGEGLSDPTPATRTVTVTAGQDIAPDGTIVTPATDTIIQAGQSVSFSGAATDPDNSPGAMTFQWTFGAGSGVPDSTAQSPGDVVFPNAGTFQVTFTVTDGEGLSDPTPASRTITVTAASKQSPAMCGVCGSIGPFFSTIFIASYVGFIWRRRKARRAARR